MAEPTTTSSAGLLALFVVLLGPLAGPYVYIVFGALIGAATALGSQPATTRMSGALFILRIMFISLLFTAPSTAWLAQVTSLPVEILMGAVAYLIGWKWDAFSERLWRAIQTRIVGIVKGES